MKKYLFIILLVGVGFGQDDSTSQNHINNNFPNQQEINDKASDDLRIKAITNLATQNYKTAKNTLFCSSIINFPGNFCLGTIAGGYLGKSITFDLIFMGMLVGGTYLPVYRYKKQKKNILKVKYPSSIKPTEMHIYRDAYLGHLGKSTKKCSAEKSKNMDSNKDALTIAGIGCLGFVAIMHILMNTDVYFDL